MTFKQPIVISSADIYYLFLGTLFVIYLFFAICTARIRDFKECIFVYLMNSVAAWLKAITRNISFALNYIK